MPANDQDWRFRDFKNTGGAYNATLSVNTPEARAGFERQYGASPESLGRGNVNAASRVIPSPSGTNWDATFGASQRSNGVNAPSSPSGTDWQKTFGGQRSAASGQTGSAPRTFSFNLSPSSDKSQLSIATPATDFYKDRVANMDLTRRDHEMYGAGSHYGFAF